METTGLVPRVAQAVTQLSSVVKSNAVAFKALHKRTDLIEVPGIRSVFFAHAFKRLTEMQEDLNSVSSLIQNGNLRRRFLQTPVLRQSLEDIHSKLIHLGHFFATIRVLGSMITSLQAEMKALALGTLSSS